MAGEMMRYKNRLETLANQIALHDAKTIRRTIQSTAHSSKSEDEKARELQNLRIAESFIQLHPTLPENWRSSLDCFKDLAQYFIEHDSVEDHEEKAMCCWYLLLNEAIPNDFPFEEIISLGKVYSSDLYKFSAFIVWLLDKGVSPYSISRSTLLHTH